MNSDQLASGGDPKKSHDFLVFSMFSLITVLTWTGLSIYRAFGKSKPPQVSEAELASLDPSLDVGVLDNLEGRIHLTREELGGVVLILPTQAPQATESATPSAEVTP